MTRTVLDTALMLGVMAGPDILDPLTIAREKPDFTAAARPETSSRAAHRLAPSPWQ